MNLQAEKIELIKLLAEVVVSSLRLQPHRDLPVSRTKIQKKYHDSLVAGKFLLIVHGSAGDKQGYGYTAGVWYPF